MFNLNNINHVEVLHFWTGFGAADAIWEFEIWQASLDLWSYYQRFQINAQIKQQVWDLKPGPIPVGINFFIFFFMEFTGHLLKPNVFCILWQKE